MPKRGGTVELTVVTKVTYKAPVELYLGEGQDEISLAEMIALDQANYDNYGAEFTQVGDNAETVWSGRVLGEENKNG